ncbi:uncharacterized protein TNCV_3237752 [Trichonephila clavipes]|nr:uncharacterized protein TNCV_3237752 [Trichonephila clavipes]
MGLLKNCKDFFKDLRPDTAFNEMLCDARELADEIDILANFEHTQPRHRVRRRNVNFDYEAQDDPIEDPTLKYNAFYFFTLDKAINALKSRTQPKDSRTRHTCPVSALGSLELESSLPVRHITLGDLS